MIGTWIEEIKSILRTELSSLEDFLLAPAGDVEIAYAEQAMGVLFPEDLKQLYHTHNGESRSGPGFFFGLQFLTLDEMVSEWKIWSDLQDEYGDMSDHYSIPTGWVKEQYINRSWIPFCHDGGGNHLGIDLDPGENGIIGQVINFGRDEETKFVIARNLSEFIHFMRDVVRNGNYTVEQEEGMGYWMYGRTDQARLLRDAQQYAFGSEWNQKKDRLSSDELAVWAAALPQQWQERIKNDYVSWQEFVQLYQIHLPNEQISDIHPLAQCTEVRELSLSRNEIKDISPLASCHELKKLYLLHNPIEDLFPLANLRHLRQLNISDTPVYSIEPLAALPCLAELECERTAVTDYRPLLSIPTLTSLSISSPTREQAEVISEMQQLKHLTVIDAEKWQQADWELISKLPLLSLTVTDVKWKDAQHLRHFSTLKNLTLAHIELKDISALALLPKLQKLSLAGENQITNLETIALSPTLGRFVGDSAQVELLQNAFSQPVDFSVQYNGRYNN